MAFAELEERTGLRFSWIKFPFSHEDVEYAEVPLGCLLTPLKASGEEDPEQKKIPVVNYMPVRCRNSGVFLNPYSNIDFRAKTWSCPITSHRNALPKGYAERITPDNLPAEMTHESIEYIIPLNISGGIFPPTIIFLVDLCLPEEELDQLKDSLQQVISMLPSKIYVGLVTFGTVIRIHELSDTEVPRCYVLRGASENSVEYLKKILNLDQFSARFLQPLSACEIVLNSFIENLRPDPWPVTPNCRPNRCTGSAISAATSLLKNSTDSKGGRVMLFLGGPCTQGPGKIVDVSLAEQIRHHLDLQRDHKNARFVKSALAYYTRLAGSCAASGVAVDIFACSLDQSGLHEMKILCDRTGGYMVMSDSFSMSVFKDSLKKIFSLDSRGHMKQGYNAKIELFSSKRLKVCGAIGPCTSCRKSAENVSDLVVGEGKTSEWQISSLDPSTTIAFFFDIPSVNTAMSALNSLANLGERSEPGDPDDAPAPFIQFQTVYYHSDGTKRLRVTSFSSKWARGKDMGCGFDQEAAAVLTARYALFKSEKEDVMSVLRWLDRMLIRLAGKFSDFAKNEPHTFKLNPEFSFYPQFMYHLRRSHFLQTFNASPDETAYYRAIINRETVVNSLLMIQPALLEYTFNVDGSHPVLLDAQSLKSDVILLLDSFFHIIIWYGESIHKWREEGYQEREEYEHFKRLLQRPSEDAKELLEGRFPTPKFVLCNQGGSQARFLLAKVNPSRGFGEGVVVETDDVAMGTFMESLVRLVVT